MTPTPNLVLELAMLVFGAMLGTFFTLLICAMYWQRKLQRQREFILCEFEELSRGYRGFFMPHATVRELAARLRRELSDDYDQHECWDEDKETSHGIRKQEQAIQGSQRGRYPRVELDQQRDECCDGCDHDGPDAAE